MSPQYISYSTIALLCAAALFYFCSNLRRYAPVTVANRFFYWAVFSSGVCAVTEFCFGFHESGLVTNLVYCYVTEIVYSLTSLVCGFCWFMSSEIEQEAVTVSTKTRRILCAVPIALMMIVNLTTPIHHQLFYFTEDGHYVRGILSTPFVVITAVYIAKSGFFALGRALQRKHYLKRERLMTYFYYALAILIAQVLQIVLGSVLPFRIVGAVVVFFVVQDRTIKGNVFIDIVSDANNRTAMDRYLRTHFDSADEQFTLTMIDIDSFKEVNDRYGHSLGDRAILLLSTAFKLVLPGNLFFARYGGDEFVVIGDVTEPADLEQLMFAVGDKLHRLCEAEKLPFRLEFSYGTARKTAEIRSVPDLISSADAAMYLCKEKHKAAQMII